MATYEEDIETFKKFKEHLLTKEGTDALKISRRGRKSAEGKRLYITVDIPYSSKWDYRAVGNILKEFYPESYMTSGGYGGGIWATHFPTWGADDSSLSVKFSKLESSQERWKFLIRNKASIKLLLSVSQVRVQFIEEDAEPIPLSSGDISLGRLIEAIGINMEVRV